MSENFYPDVYNQQVPPAFASKPPDYGVAIAAPSVMAPGSSTVYGSQPAIQYTQGPMMEAYGVVEPNQPLIPSADGGAAKSEMEFSWWIPIAIAVVIFLAFTFIGYGFFGCIVAFLICVISGIIIKMAYPGTRNAKKANITIAVGIVFIVVLVVIIIIMILTPFIFIFVYFLFALLYGVFMLIFGVSD